MTIKEIENSLSLDFHDSFLAKLGIDYTKQEANLELSVWLPEDDTDKEIYRRGRLTLAGFLFFAIESPGGKYWNQNAGAVMISEAHDVPPDILPKELLESLPDGAFVNRFYVSDWNSFIVVAAMDARFEWTGDPEELSGKVHYYPGDKVRGPQKSD
jgi:hypothetical protein